jgi:PIN domain nuclease of toxin-antitoxin system
VNLLLDTHAVLWWLADQELNDEARDLIASPDNLVLVSAASVWEIAIKRSLGKLRTGEDLVAAIDEAGFDPLPITFEHAEIAGALPAHHNDPFDRMLIAQAQVLGSAVVTRDAAFSAYSVDVIGC